MINDKLVPGGSMVLYVNDNPIVCSRSVSLTYTTEYIETSVSGSGKSSTILPTKDSWNVGAEGVVSVEQGNVVTLFDLRTFQQDQELVYVEIVRVSNDGTRYSEVGNGYIINSNDTGSFDGMDTFSVEIRGTGTLTLSES